MPKTSIHFPAGFLWGTATSSHQVEGGNTNNNWHAWEHVDGYIKNDDKSGLACNWWGGKWKEDLDRAAEVWSKCAPAFHRMEPCAAVA